MRGEGDTPALRAENARLLVLEIAGAYQQGKMILVLTERTEHLAAIEATLGERVQNLIGRLYREHAGKTHVQNVDFVDAGNPALMRMWAKRQVGYRAMGYRVETPAAGLFLTDDWP